LFCVTSSQCFAGRTIAIHPRPRPIIGSLRPIRSGTSRITLSTDQNVFTTRSKQRFVLELEKDGVPRHLLPSFI
jgi:hypothetical protein